MMSLQTSNLRIGDAKISNSRISEIVGNSFPEEIKAVEK
jgi:hypothetical protein